MNVWLAIIAISLLTRTLLELAGGIFRVMDMQHERKERERRYKNLTGESKKGVIGFQSNNFVA